MENATQRGRPLAVTTPLGQDVLLLVGFSGREALSQLYSFRLDLRAENRREVPFEKLLGQKLTVELTTTGGRPRHFAGICSWVSQGEQGSHYTEYQLEMVPPLWLLTHSSRCRIYQHLSVPDIVRKVLQGLDVTYKVRGRYHPRPFCVQYRESDFNFASRLMEEEGIFYYFKHGPDGCRMVVADTPQAHPDLPDGVDVPYAAERSGEAPGCIYDWGKVQELRAGRTTLWDHTFELPHKHLEATATPPESVSAGQVTHRLKLAASDRLEIYDYPGEYAQRFDGVDAGGGDRPAALQPVYEDNQRTAKLRMQEEAVPALTAHGASFRPDLSSGHKFVLSGHGHADGPYLLTAVTHQARLRGGYRSGQGGGLTYRNTFTCLPLAVPFRPSRAAPKPVVPGTQTAVVVGPPGEEIFTDKYGRVKVQFHWDREGRHNADSSCWVRVAQVWAGKRWGASFWPRVGQEVIVDFLEGDPDRPIIVGSVFNAEQMPPYLGAGPDANHPNDNKLSGVKTCTTPGGQGYNELRFGDAKDKEQVFLHAQRDLDVRVRNDSREQVGNDRHLVVGSERDGARAGDRRELVHRDAHLRVRGERVEQVEGVARLLVGGGDGPGDLDVVVKGVRKELAERDAHAHVKGDRREQVDGAASLTVGGDCQGKVGANHALDVGQAIHIKAGTTLVLEAGARLTLKVGGNFIDFSPAGIDIQGTMVNINSGGSAGSGAGANPQPPEAPAEAQPAAPAEADGAVSGFQSTP